MERRPSHTKISRADFDQFQRKISTQMRQNIDIQAELLKTISQYKAAVENMASVADKLSQVTGKLAVSTMSAFQINKEYYATFSLPLPKEYETKQKNLNLALQQVVKFHTLLSNQQAGVAVTLSADFEKPIQSNLDKYRDVVNSWDREMEKELKKISSDIRHKENEATKMGKQKTPDMDRLSYSLHELSMLVGEMERVKTDRLASALTTDHYQYILVAHHLQKILKAEVVAFRSIYYQDDVAKSQTTDVSQISAPVLATPSASNYPLIDRQPRTPLSGGFLNPVPTSPIPPPRRSSDDESSREPTLDQFNTLLRENGSSYTSYSLHSNSVPEEIPRMASVYTMKQNSNPPTPSVDQYGRPVVPRSHHRKTLVVPIGAGIEELEELIEANFGKNLTKRQSVMPPSLNENNGDGYNGNGWKNSQSISRSSYYSKESMEGLDPASDLSLVVYDYIGAEADDLSVLEGDILRIVAVEDEWIYGILMVPTYEGSSEFIPAMINGAHQIGWIPKSFTRKIE